MHPTGDVIEDHRLQGTVPESPAFRVVLSRHEFDRHGEIGVKPPEHVVEEQDHGGIVAS